MRKRKQMKYEIIIQYATNESNFINQYVTNRRGNAEDAS